MGFFMVHFRMGEDMNCLTCKYEPEWVNDKMGYCKYKVKLKIPKCMFVNDWYVYKDSAKGACDCYEAKENDIFKSA